ncbi:MAG: DUF58 domain-containing protein [Proteobacteria bacterium]|nr:DUF58 domain-containing protein [Pseudomonadota bacterium]
MAVSALPLRQRAEQLAATLPPLMVAAERVASTVAQGVHGRRRVGQGETFWQFRGYHFGDQPQSIDWRQSAKSDRVYVRQMEWEAAQSVWVWCDTSASMNWRSSPDHPDKRERAELLALALTALLVRGGEHVALLGSGVRPLSGRSALGRLATLIEQSRHSGADLPPVLPLPRDAQTVLIGDFLTPLEAVEAVVRGYVEDGVKGYILQVLDMAEETLPYDGRVRFEGLEGEDPWLLSRVESVRRDYVARLGAQRAGLRAIARGAGWTFATHRTNQPPQSALLALYAALTQAPGRGYR